ncbi:sulfatase [Roseibacillus ishigakijimensis]|uniref:Sulfatase n=1 Tax=Roseibacillus ishigakijimensis TaxID=454146 RepID=A0A934VLT4_9BACT|nr:sulfatase [Roseibacillus ishigakijimensis]MBK1833225.1 sulfatase [Roseibacillus ishigakijimensis]
MRQLLFPVLLLLAPFLAGEDRPHILFCMADDWGWPHAGAYGDEGVATPTFDRLAREGALFHHFYTCSPSCTPSRNGVITGKYHWRLGPGANLWSTLPAEHESFIHLLADAGYAIGQNPPKTWGPGRIKSWQAVHGEDPAGPTYATFGEFLQANDPADQPFCFWLASSDPHRGYKKGSGQAAGIDPEKVHLFDHFPDTATIRNDVADYYFEVQRWDTLVGQALAQLEERGLLEDTIVIMTGDHGMPFPRGKGNLYDSGVRVPFAVRWGEKVRSGHEIADFISFVDIAPTLLELTGTALPEELSGRSFAPLLLARESGRLDAEGRPDIIFGRERHVPAQEKPSTAGYPSRGLRTEDFLYLKNYEPDRWPMGTGDADKVLLPGQWYADCDSGPSKNAIIENREKDEAHRRAYELCFAKRPAEELYDLRSDPDQVNNLAASSEHRDTLEKLRQRLQERLEAADDPRAKNPHFTGFDDFPYFGTGGGKRK